MLDAPRPTIAMRLAPLTIAAAIYDDDQTPGPPHHHGVDDAVVVWVP